MRRLGQTLLIILFLGIIFTMPVLTKLQKNQVISQFENRRLAEVPVLSKAGLLSGEYFAKWETYLSDHIYGRNSWIRGYTFMNMQVLGKSSINNIVVGKDGFLLPLFAYDGKYDIMNNPENLGKMAVQMKELQDKVQGYGGSFLFVGVPSQASYHRAEYPSHFQNNGPLMDQTEKTMFSDLTKLGVSYIDMNTVFHKKPDVEYYYKTDHHYNFEGAYTTYYEIIKKVAQNTALGIRPPMEKSDLDIVTLPNPFGGSRNRQIYYMFPTEEHLKIAYPKQKVAFEKYNNGKADPKLYYLNVNPSAMVNYGVYMGGDWAETIIRTKNTKLPNALIFGDSFTNAIEPLLFNHFNETRILDLRHYTKMGLYDYIEQYKPDVVIMVRDDLNYGNFEGNGSFKGENVKR